MKIQLFVLALLAACGWTAFADVLSAPLSLGEAAEDLTDACSIGKPADARRYLASAEAAARRIATPSDSGGRVDASLALTDDLLGRARELCARGASPSGALAANQLTLVALELEPQANTWARRLVWFDYLANEIILRAKRSAPDDRAVVERRARSLAALWVVLRPGFVTHAKLVADGDKLAGEFGRPASLAARARQGAKAADFVDELEKAGKS